MMLVSPQGLASTDLSYFCFMPVISLGIDYQDDIAQYEASFHVRCLAEIALRGRDAFFAVPLEAEFDSVVEIASVLAEVCGDVAHVGASERR